MYINGELTARPTRPWPTTKSSDRRQKGKNGEKRKKKKREKKRKEKKKKNLKTQKRKTSEKFSSNGHVKVDGNRAPGPIRYSLYRI